jgi:hypothetical protein
MRLEKEERSALIKAVAEVVKEHVAAALSQVLDRIKALEERKPAEALQGEPGPQGERGEVGPAGKDAEPVNVSDIVAAVLSQIPQPQPGEKGEPGPQGEKGEQGIAGKGERGEKGEPGEAGRNGIDGKDGRDALQIDILPAVDFSRSYPRGTFARFDGGIIRSFRDTAPCEEPLLALELLGWEVAVAGVPCVSCSLSEDGRTVSITTRTTGSENHIKTFDIPTMIYRGIFDPQKEYTQGDVVTWGGSAWHCQDKTTSAPNEKSEAWKLMVKEGRRGKDGPQGPQGIEGKQGKTGEVTLR